MYPYIFVQFPSVVVYTTTKLYELKAFLKIKNCFLFVFDNSKLVTCMLVL